MAATTNGKPQAPLWRPSNHPFPYGPTVDWPPWRAPLALVSAFALALLGAGVVDIGAALSGVRVVTHHTPGGLVLADTLVQDLCFVLAVVIFAQLGGAGALCPWQLGLRPSRWRWGRSAVAVVATYLVFLLGTVIWATALGINHKEKILESLGANEATSLLVLSAALTCLIAPVCEELLFRGFFFRALANWRGPLPAALITAVLFGAVHAGSAPADDLLPLAFLGFLLCALYWLSGSLYPTIAVHALNNGLAFGDLEGWPWWGVVALGVGAVFLLAVIRAGLERTALFGRAEVK